MKLAKGAARPRSGEKKVVSRVDAVLIMIAAAAAAVATTFLTVSEIIAAFTGPVTLTLPLHSPHQSPTGLGMDSVARFTAMEATIPALPLEEAVLLAWAGALNQASFLAVAALLFLLAFRLRGENLFTPASAWIVGACGVVLALAGSVAQALDAAARTRIAELIAANQRTPGELLVVVSDFNIAPLLAGIVLVLVAGVFQFGRRLQRDTEGLI
jgi:hypothetical protein